MYAQNNQVTCNKNPTWENSLWYIETNEHAQCRLRWSQERNKRLIRHIVSFDAEKVNYVKPGFFDKFFELQAVMWHTNAGLTDRHSYDSRPQHWPILRRGIVLYLLRFLRAG